MKIPSRLATNTSCGLLGCALIAVQVCGCIPCAQTRALRVLRATILGTATSQPLRDVQKISAFTFTDGASTGSGGGGRIVMPSLENGSFELRLVSDETGSVCGSPVQTSRTPSFPAPDEILVIVQREACEQQFTIEINEDTVVDLDFPDFVIELKDPILVPPCGEESGN